MNETTKMIEPMGQSSQMGQCYCEAFEGEQGGKEMAEMMNGEVNGARRQ